MAACINNNNTNDNNNNQFYFNNYNEYYDSSSSISYWAAWDPTPTKQKIIQTYPNNAVSQPNKPIDNANAQ